MNAFLGKLKKYFSIISLILVFSKAGFAYDHDRCEKGVEKYKAFKFLDVSISSTQFVSSTGACRMIGMAGQEKKDFLVQNIDQLQIDLARGKGEYLDAYASLSGCNQDAKKVFPGVLKSNYAEIFSDKDKKEPLAVYDSIEKAILSDPVTSAGCKVKS